MPSFIGWLDYSEAERRQVQEMLQLFSEKGTVDDLGIGTIRDAISNRLFPGTSVIQTRARYFLFIPWIFQRAETRHRSDLLPRAEVMERRLIEALRTSDDQEGLIGRQAGKDVRTLPSAIYWTGLAAYDIFQRGPLTRAQYARAARNVRSQAEQEDELADRGAAFWRPGIPDPPEGFFDFASADFELTREEAEWLSERVLSTDERRGPNLLGDYVAELRCGGTVPAREFWAAPLPERCAPETRELVRHAERFSSAMQGASLLYNLMLAEARNDEDRGDRKYAAQLREDLDDWADDARAAGTPAWAADSTAFWQLITNRSRVPVLTRAFVQDWCHMLATADLGTLADHQNARTLIRSREQQHKRAQARFGNPARLRSWPGESGTARLEFRWTQVRRFLNDLSAGLGTATPVVVQEVTHAAN
jgi:hypothetical protein